MLYKPLWGVMWEKSETSCINYSEVTARPALGEKSSYISTHWVDFVTPIWSHGVCCYQRTIKRHQVSRDHNVSLSFLVRRIMALKVYLRPAWLSLGIHQEHRFLGPFPDMWMCWIRDLMVGCRWCIGWLTLDSSHAGDSWRTGLDSYLPYSGIGELFVKNKNKYWYKI